MLGDVLDSEMLFHKIFNLMYFNGLNLSVKYNIHSKRVIIKDSCGNRYNELFHMSHSEFDSFVGKIKDLKLKLRSLNNSNSIVLEEY